MNTCYECFTVSPPPSFADFPVRTIGAPQVKSNGTAAAKRAAKKRRKINAKASKS